ncbi:hypothetical protein HGRIS_014567 [Hohenbuehelia grisea]|uniref:Carboxylic ester hydrolase n=1 Tax=Hohenbuehelia grisea TaxID=104357 RepID=A0ABR3JVM5_9AGAR
MPSTPDINTGGFQFGSTASYDGGSIVERSIELNEPVIYVSMNYRLSAFGFLASQEIREAGLGNLGLQDQRQALRWVQKYIASFGGDPMKVTIWGESAGAISVTMQMLAFDGNTEGLFRAAFMESGGPWPAGDITHGQKYYDQVVGQTGCQGTADTLACLRTVPFSVLKAAADNLPSLVGFQSLAAPGEPRVDGVFLSDSPQRLVQQGKVPPIPFVTGNCEDEGTVFGLQSLNVTTDSQFRNYIKTVFIPDISDADLNTLSGLYPQDPIERSPYNTGFLYTLTPQFKRIASLLGDMTLVAPRRFLLQQRSDKQSSWSFLSSRLKTTPILGSFHSSDLLQAYGPSELRDYLINFVNHLDPNGQRLPSWPKYTTASPRLMTFTDNVFIPTLLSLDNFRAQAIQFVTNLLLQHPF